MPSSLIRTRCRRAAHGVALFVVLLGVGLATEGAAQTPWPTDGWAVATPADVGLDVAVLDSIDAEIRAGRYGYVDRFLVVRHGRLAYDRRYRQDYDAAYGDSARASGRSSLRPHDPDGPYNYFNAWWHPYYRRGDLHTLQSVTKTVTSMVIGAAVTRGDFPSIDTPVLSFFDADTVANVDDRKRRMTIRHLLTMTSGLAWNEDTPYNDPTNSAGLLEASYDWVGYTIDQPMAEEPGATFNYNSGATELLAHVFRQATGTDIEEYAARHLFGPVGIRDWHWKRTPAGTVDTEGGLYLASEDLAKLWYLYVRGGTWDGTPVVSPAWVQESVAPAVSVDARPTYYGFKWWLHPNPLDASRWVWAGSGFGGQRPMAVPEDDLIVVFNQWNILPDQASVPPRQVLARILRGVLDRR